MSVIENVSRRRFLQGGLAAGVFVLAVKFVPEALHSVYADEPAPPALEPSLWMSIVPDGTVTIMFSDIEDSTVLTERLGDQVLRGGSTNRGRPRAISRSLA